MFILHITPKVPWKQQHKEQQNYKQDIGNSENIQISSVYPFLGSKYLTWNSEQFFKNTTDADCRLSQSLSAVLKRPRVDGLECRGGMWEERIYNLSNRNLCWEFSKENKAHLICSLLIFYTGGLPLHYMLSYAIIC